MSSTGKGRQRDKKNKKDGVFQPQLPLIWPSSQKRKKEKKEKNNVNFTRMPFGKYKSEILEKVLFKDPFYLLYLKKDFIQKKEIENFYWLKNKIERSFELADKIPIKANCEYCGVKIASFFSKKEEVGGIFSLIIVCKNCKEIIDSCVENTSFYPLKFSSVIEIGKRYKTDYKYALKVYKKAIGRKKITKAFIKKFFY